MGSVAVVHRPHLLARDQRSCIARATAAVLLDHSWSRGRRYLALASCQIEEGSPNRRPSTVGPARYAGMGAALSLLCAKNRDRERGWCYSATRRETTAASFARGYAKPQIGGAPVADSDKG